MKEEETLTASLEGTRNERKPSTQYRKMLLSPVEGSP